MLAVIALIAGGTAMQGGLNAVIQNISQLHTRPGAVLVWGIHWRYHLLERLALILLGFALVGAHRSLLLASSRSFAYGRISLFAFALSLFAGLTAMFGLNSDPFRDAIFLGHQAREIFTHALVTVPLAVAGCLWVTEQVVMPPLRGNENRHGLVYAAASLGCLLTLYVVVGAFFTGAGSKAQTGNLTAVVLGHFFEHAFTYLVTPLTAVVFYLWSAGPSRR